MSQTREPATPINDHPKKQLRFDTDEVYLAYLGKSTPKSTTAEQKQFVSPPKQNSIKYPPKDQDIEKRIKEAKVNLEWKIALKLKQRAQEQNVEVTTQKPPSVVTLRKSPPKSSQEKSPYRRPPGVPSHIVSPPKNKSVVRTNNIGQTSTDSQSGKPHWNFSTRSETEMTHGPIKQVKSPTTAASSDHGQQNQVETGFSRNHVKLQKASLPT